MKLTYKYYRHTIGHSWFVAFMLGQDLAWIRRLMFIGWLFLCGWIAWNAPHGCGL